jgi:hypothetical protein
MRKIKSKIQSEIEEVKQEVRNKTVGYIVTALGLVAGLAWNDAVKALIEYLFPTQKDTLQAKFIYALIISMVVVFFSVYLVKFFKEEKKDTDEKEVKKK